MAMAKCDSLTFSSTHVDMGSRTYSSLPDAQLAGHKLAGTRTVALRASCDDRPDVRQLNVLLPMALDVPGLVRWGSMVAGAERAGAARITVRQVVAGGRAVPMTFTPAGGPATTLATQGPLTLAGPGTLSVDLRGVSSEGDARKTLLVDLQIQTLLRSPGFEPVGATPFGFNMAVSLP
ncbi:MAG: hypothetical protein EOP13_19700 [Pseudomonas sp.]|jgi:hypothetical protein|uniref:hypothetical protein n=1 Tax=Pseudomonas sp. TaxID=306 RepID=UPI00120E1618|nr:hypothetical protein [Pseudomonas sp.]RZI70892.1 MAG: hypothetical protein EOP13_19700 [Pseudomonas sp.]